MNIFRKFYCRVYQTIFQLYMPLLPYRTPTILSDYDEILKVIEENGCDNALIVTDKEIKNLGLTNSLTSQFDNKGVGYSIFDETLVNPTIDNVNSAVEQYKEKKCDCIIAFGGGSPIDCAKAVGACIANPHKSLKDMGGVLKVNKKLPLLIAIPTTAGTGSEATVSAVITDEENHHKFIINDLDLIPNYTLLDAKLTVSLNKHITATTGMDALTHAIEAFIGRSTTKSTRRNALAAIKLIFENLPIVCEDGENLLARKRMLKASHKAGLAFTKSYVGYVHAIAHSLGGKYNISHGLANAVLLPHILKKYGKSVYKKLWNIAVFCGVCDKATPRKVAAELLIGKIEEMNKSMEIPNKISCLKLEDIAELAKIASKEANPLYPVPKLMNAKELESIYHEILKK